MKHLKQFSTIMLLAIITLMSSESKAYMFWNQTCQFAGTSSSYISAPGNTTANITGDFSLEAWVNPSNVSSLERGIFAKGSTLGASLRYGLKINNIGRVTITTNGILRLTSTVSLTANTWTHVCATFDDVTNTFAIYFNGSLNTSAIVAGAVPTSNNDSLYIGVAGTGNFFVGQLDEVRLWSRVLTGTEVTQNFRSTIGTSTSIYNFLELSYTFQNRHSGGTSFNTLDWTGNGIHGNGRNVTGVSQTNTLYTTILHNESIVFNGSSDYAKSISTSEVSPSSQITLEAWVYPRSYTGSPSIISKNSLTSYKLGLSATGKVQFYPKGGASVIESKAGIAQMRWTHIAATYNGTTTSVYINGKLDTANNLISGGIGINSDSLIVGCDNTGGSNSNFFSGYIDEVRIAHYAKTSDQVNGFTYRSIDSLNQPNPASINLCYNFDGGAFENCDGGPRFYLRGSSRFSHPGGVSNQPISPLVRSDLKPFSEGYNIKSSGKRVPLTGGSGTTVDSMIIPFNISISDINVFVSINHFGESDLDVYLTGPNGEFVTLSTDGVSAGGNDNLITIFDDQATNSVLSTTFTSFSPTVRGDSNINNKFTGDLSQGLWLLTVTDDGGPADTGRIDAWGLQFNNAVTSNKVSSLNLNVLIQGFYSASFMSPDTARVYLRNTTAPYTITDSGKVFLNSAGNGNVSFINTPTSSKYITVRHRNSVETWSAAGVSFSTESVTNYDFTTAVNKAYGNNQVLVDGKYCIYNGNINTDIFVDLTDVIGIYNDANAFLVGYFKSDLTGDNFVDLTDIILANNNASNFISVITPP